jgi:hypothetical protein
LPPSIEPASIKEFSIKDRVRRILEVQLLRPYGIDGDTTSIAIHDDSVATNIVVGQHAL